MLGYLALGLLLVALIHLTGKRLLTMDAATFRRNGMIWLLLVILGIMALLARFGYPRFALLLGGTALLIGAVVYGLSLRPGRKSQNRILPYITTSCLAITLNPATGSMRVMVTQGAFMGQEVDQLDEAELKQLYMELKDHCADSLDVFQAWLNQQSHMNWRQEWDIAEETEHGGAFSGTMSEAEARRVLGIASPHPGVRTIQNAHRRLMRRFHTDKGAGIFIPTVFNVARDVLLEHKKKKP